MPGCPLCSELGSPRPHTDDLNAGPNPKSHIKGRSCAHRGFGSLIQWAFLGFERRGRPSVISKRIALNVICRQRTFPAAAHKRNLFQKSAMIPLGPRARAGDTAGPAGPAEAGGGPQQHADEGGGPGHRFTSSMTPFWPKPTNPHFVETPPTFDHHQGGGNQPTQNPPKNSIKKREKKRENGPVFVQTDPKMANPSLDPVVPNHLHTPTHSPTPAERSHQG